MARNIVVSNMSFCIQLRKINRSFYYCYYFELEFATVLPQCVNKIIVSIHRSWFSMIKLHFFVRLFGLLLVKSDSDFNYVLLKWESVKKNIKCTRSNLSNKNVLIKIIIVSTKLFIFLPINKSDRRYSS